MEDMITLLTSRTFVSLPAEAIVCSANNWLKMGTGSAGAVLKAGGQIIQDECDKLLSQHGWTPFSIGSAVYTHSGNLKGPNKQREYVIHAIGMGYKKRVGDHVQGRILATPHSVYQAVMSAMRVAADLGVRSIAFPLMCARPGYSILSEEESPIVMAESMLKAIQSAKRQGIAVNKVWISIPERYILGEILAKLLEKQELEHLDAYISFIGE